MYIQVTTHDTILYNLDMIKLHYMYKNMYVLMYIVTYIVMYVVM